jgi:hypothetical protein
MPCPICDKKPMNCDCTDTERRQYSAISDLEELADALHAKITRLEKENLALRGLCGLSPKQPIPEMMS